MYVYIWKHYAPTYMSGAIDPIVYSGYLGVVKAGERITGNFCFLFSSYLFC